MTRKHERRLQRFFQKRKLLFVSVGGVRSEDRVIDPAICVGDATRSNPEYNALLRDIATRLLES